MAETPASEPGQTPSGATDPKGSQGATQPDPSPGKDGEKVILSKEDYQNLVAGRDRGNNRATDLEDQMAEMVAKDQKSTFIKSFLQENADKFPNVSAEDLMLAGDPDSVEALAKTLQRSKEDAEQAALQKLQDEGAPKQLTQEEAEKELEALEKSDDPDAFEKAVAIQLNTTK